MITEHDETFLRGTRLAFLSTAEGAAWSRPVPVWYEWDGASVQMFSSGTAPKVGRLRADPRAHVLVANNLGEAEHWVSVTGDVAIGDADMAWIESLAARYWDLTQPATRATLDGWLAHREAFIGLTLTPDAVRSGG